TLRATEGNWLARDNARHRVTDVHRVSIHEPGHNLGIGVHVGRWDVLVRTDHELDLGRVASGQILELRLGEELRIDGHTAFGSAIWQASYRAFPGHEHCQGLDFLERHILVEADTTLGWSRSGVVLDAVAGKDLH